MSVSDAVGVCLLRLQKSMGRQTSIILISLFAMLCFANFKTMYVRPKRVS